MAPSGGVWPRQLPAWMERRGFIGVHIRQGIQMASTTCLILATFSYPGIWRRLSLNDEFVSPMLIGIWLSVLFLVRPITRQGMFRLGFQMMMAAAVCISLALACMYITVGILGNSYDNSTTKAVVLLLFSTPIIFVTAVYRVMLPANRFPGLCGLLFFSLTICGSYHTPLASLTKFPSYLLLFACIAVVFTWFTSFLVTPTPAGLMARMAVAQSLRNVASLLGDITDLILGDIDEVGHLAAARGEGASGALNIDTGLYPQVMAIHHASYASGKRITASREHGTSARYEFDLYRRAHLFPFRPFWKLNLLTRSLCSAVTVMLYPVQSGELRLTLVHAHTELFERVRAQAGAALEAAADCLETNAPISPGLDALVGLHAALGVLIHAFQRLPAELALTPDSMAFHIMATNLLTATSQIRRIYQVLPAVLAADQPEAGKEVLRCLQKHPAADLSRVVMLQTMDTDNAVTGRDALGALQASLIHRGSCVRRSAIGLDEFLMDLSSGAEIPGMRDRLMRHSVAKVEPVPMRPPSRYEQLVSRLTQRTGVTPIHLRIATQTATSYLIIMIFTVVDDVYNGLQGRTVWAMVTAMSVAETSIGAVYHKGLLRVLGTVVGAALGLATLYLAVLCNGLDHDNNPAKFIVTTASLTVITGVGAMLCAWDPANTFGYMAGSITLFGAALPGYASSRVYWNYGLLRALLTVVGTVVHMVVAQCVLPVSSRATTQTSMAGLLGSLADLGTTMLRRLVPGAGPWAGDVGGRRPPTLESANAGGITLSTEPTLTDARDSAHTATLSSQRPERSVATMDVARAARTARPSASSPVGSPRVERSMASAPAQTRHLPRERGRRAAWVARSSLYRGTLLERFRVWRSQFSMQAGPGVIADDPRPVGPVFLELYKTLWPTATKIAGLAPLVDTLPFEYELFHVPHRLPVSAAFKAQRLFRHILNTMTTFASSMDAQRLSHLALLGPEAEQVATLSEQLRECLLGLQGMLQGRVKIQDALEAIEALDYHTEHLFLHFLTDQLTSASEKTLVIQTLALISLLFNLSWVTRRLAINLIHMFWGKESAEAQQAETFFGDARRWAIDEDLMFAAQGALGVSLAASPGATLSHHDEGGHEEGLASWQTSGVTDSALTSGVFVRSSADLLTLANSSLHLGLGEGLGSRTTTRAHIPDIPEEGPEDPPAAGQDSQP